MRISGIYQIQSKIKPERIYIGSAVDIGHRWNEHLRKLRNGKHINPKLQHHYNKYGKNDLIFSILIGCAKDDLITIEQFYIDSKKCWFNLCPKAGSSLGLKRSEESRKKRSEDSKGEKNHFYGKSHSEESNERRRKWNLEHPRTPEMIEQQRQSLIKHYGNKKLKELGTINQN
jgi:group I intron endonuclease